MTADEMNSVKLVNELEQSLLRSREAGEYLDKRLREEKARVADLRETMKRIRRVHRDIEEYLLKEKAELEKLLDWINSF